MESPRPLHLIIKRLAMTNHEILQSSMLDILFENRNKQYGAYALRKYYANRMGIALAISLSSVVLLMFLWPSTYSSEVTTLPEPPGVILSTVTLPEEPVEPEPPAPQPQAAPIQRAMIDHQTIDIVPDHLVTDPLPTMDDMRNAIIGNATVVGTPDDGTLIPAAVNIGTGDAVTTNPEPAQPTGFDPVEVQPAFPGGVEAWRNFLSKYLQAPDELEAGERRTVQVRFMVSINGEVTDFEIVQSAGASFDREVLRVMKKMPKWTPAIQNGHHIAVSFVQPVTFQGIEE